MAKKHCILTLTTLALALLLCACGYSFRHQQSNLPAHIKTIAIPMFENKTNEVRLEGLITEQMRYQFSQSQILKLVDSEEADVILQGSINGVSSDDVSLTERTRSEIRRVRISISAKLIERETGEVLYSGGASQWRTYTVAATDNLSTEAARREALRQVARDASLIIHDGVLQNF